MESGMNEELLLPSTGTLQINITSFLGERPIANASIKLYPSPELTQPLYETQTDQNGQSPEITLSTPNEEYSEEPSVNRPYAEYTLFISAFGYENINIVGIKVFPNETSIQNISLMPENEQPKPSAEVFILPENTLYGDFPEKIPEAEIKPVSETGEIVLSRVVVPEYIIVHDGPPSNNSAKNYYVKYKDYIKNVASSEIYATWSEATIIANVLAIQSFTLNRVYTEWYRNKGYDFNITSSTAYDQCWVYNQNIYQNISQIVDTLFDQYIARPNVTQPLLTQYCDGKRVTCPNWLSQWGSKALGDEGYSASEILKYYYGDSVYIATADEISGIPSSWPGSNLSVGSSGNKVAQLQRQLNVIAKNYPLIPKISEDGIYGEKTANAVKTFQKIFKLPQTGITDFATWYKISEIYVGVSRIAELN